MPRRSRESLVDFGLVILAIALSLATSRVGRGQLLSLFPHDTVLVHGLGPLESLPLPLGFDNSAQGLAVLGCCLLCWRRHWPVPVALTLLGLGAITSAVTTPALVALFTVAARRSQVTTVWIAALTALPVPVYVLMYPLPATIHPLDLAGQASILIAYALAAGAIGWGLFVRSRGLYVFSLVERAERAETEAVLRAEHAQRQAREEIAREMHDVLAHRLSLLSVHAGALEFNHGASEEEIERAAGIIRDTAHQALQDLRTVIGVLRAPNGYENGDGRPQPGLADMKRLVEESRDAGMTVEVDHRLVDCASVGTITGRTAYRVVQEGLTNARKHAPGAAVRVTLTGGPEEGLTVEVHNAVHGNVSRAGVPGTGQGLTGLAERAVLAGGRLEYETAGFRHRLSVWLPWPT